MTDINYKKYSLENLENWLHDAMSAGEATPQEIYDVILGVVKENYYHHKHHASQAYELLSKLNESNLHSSFLAEDRNSNFPNENTVRNNFWDNVDKDVKDSLEKDGYEWTPPVSTKDKVVKWQLPVEVDGLSGECFVSFPDDLLEAANLKEEDQVEWVDRGDGSYLLRKV